MSNSLAYFRISMAALLELFEYRSKSRPIGLDIDRIIEEKSWDCGREEFERSWLQWTERNEWDMREMEITVGKS